MKYIIGLLILFHSLICAREHILSLGDFGSVHYIYDDQILLHIDISNGKIDGISHRYCKNKQLANGYIHLSKYLNTRSRVSS